MKKILLPLAIASIALASGCSSVERSRSLANPATPAKAMALQVCSNCHSYDGNSISPNFPNLASQQVPYIEEQLKSFRKHSRSDPPGFEYMWGISRSLTDQQIEGLAEYFHSQPLKPVGYRTGKAALLADGDKIFHAGVPAKNIPACDTCHGPHGQGNGKFPRIAGQHADYLAKQLMVFQRTNERPEGALMKVVAHDLTPQNIAAVTAYVETLTLK